MPIMDCDEVYNYWEPLHFWLFGSGLQTWEYANQYALRTFSYLTPLYAISKLMQKAAAVALLLVGDDDVLFKSSLLSYWSLLVNHPVEDRRVALFVVLRATLAAAMACAELWFLQGIHSKCNTASGGTQGDNKNKNKASSSSCSTVSLFTGILMLTSTGMGHAAGALLPSSTLTVLWLWCAGAYLRQQHTLFVALAVTATLALGWPFGVVLLVPLGVAVLIQVHYLSTGTFVQLLRTTCLISMGIQAMAMAVDYSHYGRWVSPTWNILLYNTFQGGDELYGVEPLTYYLKNLLLNFNYVALGGVLGLPLLLLRRVWWRRQQQRQRQEDERYPKDLLVVLIGMYAWFLVVLTRPHKEERFLFPIYPSLCLGAAIVGDLVVQSVGSILTTTTSSSTSTSLSLKTSRILQILLWTPAIVLSLSRSVALSKYYMAPLQIYAHLQQLKDETSTSMPASGDKSSLLICTCGEWYRFPSSFYLPNGASLGFVQSSFQGQLPHAFSSGGSGPDSLHLKFNNQNREEPDRYVDLDDCDYLIDLFASENCRENDSQWHPLRIEAFLDADRTSVIHRILYIPYWHESADLHGGVEYVDYALFEKIKSVGNEESVEQADESPTHSPPPLS
jgi:alpha-1,2-mannosyltransferase